MKGKINYSVFGTAPDGKEYLLGIIKSKGNAVVFAESMKRIYTDVRIK